VKRTGRHRSPSRVRPTAVPVRIAAAALPALILAGVLAGSQAQPPRAHPVASSVARYDLDALVAAGAGTADTVGDAALSPRPVTSAASAKPAASPAPSAPAPPPPACSGAGGAGGIGMLPYNYASIVNFLVAHGYTAMAAVGVAGNIYQESDGNPESIGSGGGGLIGWTPLPAGFVTGNVTADLQTQLAALLTYNQGWAQYIPMLNAATNPTDAAYVDMTYFERPGLPAASNREGAAVAVAQACGIA
jgi:hypothetical protein